MTRFAALAHLAALAGTLITSATAQQQPDVRKPYTGRFDLTLTASDGRKLPSWLEVQKSGNAALVGRFVAVVGSARPIAKIDYANDTIRFAIPPQWEGGSGDLRVEARVAGDSVSGTVTMPDGTQLPMTGVRAPALKPPAHVQWGRPLKLIGTDLAGWRVFGGPNQWSVVSGVLTNAKAGGNLATNANYGDFKLHVEFRYPAGGNSGIYLRGRHEMQIEDPALGVVATEGLGAIYGFLAPTDPVYKGTGEWQTYDITLIGRQLTVALNGKQVIVEREIPGPTGGAIDSNERMPGPIFLQGDHGPIEYRNITIAVGH